MIGDLDRATFSNIEQQSSTMSPIKLRPRLRVLGRGDQVHFLDPDDDDLCVRYPCWS
jgi:hypothetical protein